MTSDQSDQGDQRPGLMCRGDTGLGGAASPASQPQLSAPCEPRQGQAEQPGLPSPSEAEAAGLSWAADWELTGWADQY